MSTKHLSIRVTGKVQGVFFRASTREEAQRLGLCGWVRNEADGSVRIEAEGDEPLLGYARLHQQHSPFPLQTF